jgi:hypothetical protein
MKRVNSLDNISEKISRMSEIEKEERKFIVEKFL